jgi:hypothetical protein
MIETKDGELRRPIFTTLVDVYSRSILTIVVTESAVNDPKTRPNEQVSQSRSEKWNYKAIVERLFSNIRPQLDAARDPSYSSPRKTPSKHEEEK